MHAYHLIHPSSGRNERWGGGELIMYWHNRQSIGRTAQPKKVYALRGSLRASLSNSVLSTFSTVHKARCWARVRCHDVRCTLHMLFVWTVFTTKVKSICPSKTDSRFSCCDDRREIFMLSSSDTVTCWINCVARDTREEVSSVYARRRHGLVNECGVIRLNRNSIAFDVMCVCVCDALYSRFVFDTKYSGALKTYRTYTRGRHPTNVFWI